MTRLKELEIELRTGIKKSGQSSYSRRAPNAASLADLNSARSGLRELSEEDSENPRIWELLSKAEECLMNFSAAIRCCEKAIELSGKPTKDQRKRLALLKQSVAQWNKLPLTPEELKALGAYLKMVGADESIHKKTFEHTETWLENEGFSNPDEVIGEFERRGAYSDFQIYHNVILG